MENLLVPGLEDLRKLAETENLCPECYSELKNNLCPICDDSLFCKKCSSKKITGICPKCQKHLLDLLVSAPRRRNTMPRILKR